MMILVDGIEPDAFGDILPSSPVLQFSLAISAKRQADALERIADALSPELLTIDEVRSLILGKDGEES